MQGSCISLGLKFGGGAHCCAPRWGGASSNLEPRLEDESNCKLSHAGACIPGRVDVILQVDRAADAS